MRTRNNLNWVTAKLYALALTLAWAPDTAAYAQTPPSTRAPQTFTFNIQPKPLLAALADFTATTRIQVVRPNAEAVTGRSAGVSGTMSANQALSQLLAGSGLTYRFTSGGTVTIARQGGEANTFAAPAGAISLDTIEVQGANPNSTMTLMPPYAGGQVATGGQVGMLGNRNVMDTPFSITSYTNKTIKDQQAQTVQDVLSNDPSIVSNTQNSGNDYGAITFRGFRDSSENMSGSLNGLPAMSPLRAPDMDYIERVEVLRGPSALLNGMAAAGAGGVGGSYNLVTKQAGNEPLTELTTRYNSRSQPGAHLDVGRRFGAGNEFGIRFNGAFRKGDTPVEPISAETGSAALNLDYRGERVRISADIAHQSDSASPRNYQALSTSPLGFVPKAPNAGTSLSPPWSDNREKTTVAMVQGEVDITDKVTAYAAIGKQKWDFSFMGPRLARLLDTSGNYYATSNTAWRFNTTFDVLSMQGGLRATATTGPVDHALSLNLSQSRREVGEARTSGAYTYITNLYNPTFGSAPFIADPGDPKKSNETRVSSIGVADTLSILDERIQFTAGIRYQQVESGNFSTTTGVQTSSYDGKAWTPALGLIVKPWQNVSLYANYIENLQAGTIVSTSFANSGEVFPPYVSKQYEAGVKVDWGTVTTTLAAFQISQPSTISITDPGGGLSTLALDGEQRNRGIELNAYGELRPDVRLMGGVTLLDARLTKTQDGLYDGNRAYGAPIIRTVVGGEWDTPFLRGMTLTGRVTYTGDQVVSNENESLKIPSWTVVDLGARYVFDSPWNNKPITVRFNVDNVFGENYWSTAYVDILFLGAPRTYRLSTTFNF